MKKRTGKMISLSLAVAMAMTAAPVTAMADEPVKTDVIEAPALTSADQTEETTTEEGTAYLRKRQRKKRFFLMKVLKQQRVSLLLRN